MAIYYNPTNVENGDFVTAEYWNRQFGVDGSLVYLYEQYKTKTRGYHVKLEKSITDSMTSSWVINDSTQYIVSWDSTSVDYYPTDGESCWDIENPNVLTIQESGFYSINVYLNMFNCTAPITSVLYGHIVRQIEENNIITIATDHARYPIPASGSLLYPTFANQLTEFVLSINSVCHLDANDIIYVRLQPSIAIAGDTATSFVGRYAARVPTYYYSIDSRGTSSYNTTGTQSSFLSTGYVGMTPSFFEIASIRLDN
jgi:hypothetical protein